jgi:hypothetical protein
MVQKPARESQDSFGDAGNLDPPANNDAFRSRRSEGKNH